MSGDWTTGDLTLTDIVAGLKEGSLTSAALVRAYRDAWESDAAASPPLGGYIEFFDNALKNAEQADERRREGDSRPLLGAPIAVKDNILIEGHLATCGSKILEGFRAPYSATVVARLLNAGMVPLGRCNMDEFAMGSSCEYSVYGPTRNPLDRTRTPGGSSGGPAAVVAAGQAPIALGSETGGSVRLPASFCGVYGLKPSYGTFSRFGLVAFGSSLDQIGVLAKCPRDIALVLGTASGVDSLDATSAETDFAALAVPGGLAARDLRGLKVAQPVGFGGEGADPEVARVVERFASWLRDRGATVEQVPIPILEASIAIYYIIAPAEASSNLARFDGVRYGFRSAEAKELFELYASTRDQGFGAEVKRRILLGNYVLSAGYYDAYYKKAQAVRTLLTRELDKLLGSYALILTPTAPSAAFEIGEKTDDPLAMYLSDVYTIFANLAHLPSISLPGGRTSSGLPVGVQLAGARFSEELLLSSAQAWHEEGR